MSEEINIVLRDYRPISLDEMGKVWLMNRVDTKYVTTEASLLQFLKCAAPYFLVMEIDGVRIMPYSTCYYDTRDCAMYYDHVHGRAARQKIRVREYENTGTIFLEIKRKNNKGRTDKKRVRLSSSEDIADHADFVREKSVYRVEDLVPRIRNRFRRITLVNRSMTERLTVDTCLEFRNLATGLTCSLDGLAVIELKRDGSLHSPTAWLLHSLHIHPSGFSKYCIGMAMTDPLLGQNMLKPRIRAVNKMLNSR